MGGYERGRESERGLWCIACVDDQMSVGNEMKRVDTCLEHGRNRRAGETDERWEVRIKREVKRVMRAFSEEGFWVHFEGCEKARKRWKTMYRRRVYWEEEDVVVVDD
jgi:hypothetical protein